jgi:class 3 adenylate cyclase
MRDPDRLNLTGEKKEIYAIFTDLEGFTKLSHAILPEQLSVLLNRYLDVMSDTGAPARRHHRQIRRRRGGGVLGRTDLAA